MSEEKYIILSDQSSYGLAEKVNEKMAEGYVPLGGPVAPPVPKYHTSYTQQAMIKVMV